MSSLVKLAKDISSAAKAIEGHFLSNGLPDLSFDNDVLASVPPSLQEHRNALIDRSDELNRLSLGVRGHANRITFSWADELSIRFVIKYQIFNIVPLEGSCSYAAIAKATGLSEQLVQRFLRHCMGNHIFAQTSDGQVRHTAYTRELATDPAFVDGSGYQLDEMSPSSAFGLEALDRFGESGEQNETGFALFNQAFTQKGGQIAPLQDIYEVLAQNPSRGRQFGAGLRFYSKGSSQDLRQLLAGFDWTTVDNPDWTMVDIGGGHGIVSQYLAQNTEQLRFVIQDQEHTVRKGETLLPDEMKGRVQFETADFFTPQKRTAELYFTRYIFHNWSDKYAVKILKNIAPAMKAGSRLLLFEFLMRSEPEHLVTRRHAAWVIPRQNNGIS